MGRRKIEIKAIKDDRNRSVTFLKRKGGLFKKAHELSVLCSVDVAVFVFGNNKKLYEYSSIDMRELIARYQYHGGPSEHKGPSDFNGGTHEDDEDEDGDGTPPRGLNGMEAHMMPPQFQGQPQPPPPPPFNQPRHHTASASPPLSTGGPFPGRQPHMQRGHTPQPPITSRPGSRNDMRHMAMGRGMAARQPVGPPHHAPHPGMAYMTAPPPVYNQPSSLMPPAPSYPYPPHQPSQQQQQQQQQQQPYMEERRPSAPSSSFATQQPPAAHGVPAISQQRPSPPQPHHQPLHHQAPPNHMHHLSPQPERRHLDPQHPPPPQPVELRPGSSDRSKQPFGGADMSVKKLPQRKSHSIFTPIEENRSILSLHLASFAPEPPVKVQQVAMEPVKIEPGTSAVVPGPGPGHRSPSADSGPSARSGGVAGAKRSSPLLARRSSARNSSISSAAETTTASPPAQSNSLKVGGVPGGGRARGPRLTVQIPDGSSEVESAAGGSISPRNIVESPAQAPQRHNSTAVVLPPPSPSAQTLLSAGAIGPPNPFARPPPQQNISIDTPASALPSRFLNTELLPSPNSFYTDWNFRGGDSNTLPSPLNFATPVVGAGPSFLRDDAPSSSNAIATTSALLPAASSTSTAAAATTTTSTTTTALTSIVGGISSSVSVPTITTTAASDYDMALPTSGLGKRKSPESEGEGEASHDASETASDPKRLRVS